MVWIPKRPRSYVACVAVVVLAGVSAVACGTSGAPEAAVRADPPTATVSSVPEADLVTEFAIPTAETKATVVSERPFNAVRAFGGSIYVRELPADGDWGRILRIDPTSGDIVAEVAQRPPEPEWLYRSNDLATTSEGLALLDGDRSVVRLLDPVDLSVTEVDLPADSRNQLVVQDGADPLWVLQKQWDVDRGEGVLTPTGALAVDPRLGEVVGTLPVPGAGATGLAVVDDTAVLSLESLYQLATLSVDGPEAVSVQPSFPAAGVLEAFDGAVWAAWRRLGIVGRLDAESFEPIAVDLSVDGPLLRTLSGFDAAAGSIWVVGSPANPQLPPVLYRIDPTTVEVTARAFVPGAIASMSVIGDTLWFADEQGGLLAVSAASVTGGAPGSTGRVEPPTYEPVVVTSADERGVIDALERVLDPLVPSAELTDELEDLDRLAATRDELAAIGLALFRGIEPTVTALTIDGDRADLVYVFLLDDVPAIFPLTATAQRIGETDRWQISADSLCELAAQAGLVCPE